MSCKCINADGFKEAMKNAKRLSKSGTQYVVFKVNFQGKDIATFGTIEAAEKAGACCYFTTEGKEVKITKKVPKKVAKSEDMKEI